MTCCISIFQYTELLLDLEVSGDEEGAQIILPPAHALNSELLRNSSTEWRAIIAIPQTPPTSVQILSLLSDAAAPRSGMRR